MSFTGLKQPISQVLRVKFDFAANAPVGTEDIGEIVEDPALSGREEITVPANEIWHIVDIYLEDDADLGAKDGYLDLIVNNLRQNLRFGPLKQTKKTLLNPIKLRQAIVVDRLSRISFVFKLREAMGASAGSNTITVEIVRIPVG